jgi:CubicO group peptidase (beta-lactamase class C family)
MNNSEMSDFDTEWARAYIDSNFWKPAKMKETHAYVVREWQPERDHEFVAMVNLIRAYGKAEYFYRSKYIYLYLDGYKYWTMGNPSPETTIINRCDWANFYNTKKN